ncbi:GNAT family N-acetyltransferase [Salaquimonas pukyongi]|uniref:GNAT family N-acetyltransferase n=1 Tax=Salaquimonas pukyongi TaxID=2712698 RepID=UPI00096BB5B4|nr:GNAT family N-acetyltransferase [Salaquimonas pukyongi]
MDSQASFSIRIHASINAVDAATWDRLAQVPSGTGAAAFNPFVSHAFLSALEDSGSAVAETGWLAQHLILENDSGKALAALPCYLKNHSQGEYVFDHGWADAFYRAGGEYYPKLQCSVPFTPATGPRFLTGQAHNRQALSYALINGLQQLTQRLGASSAHITFMPKAEWQLSRDAGLLARTDRQFHWFNRGYENFETFLQSLSSRKRKNIRKERKTALSVPGLEIEHLTGSKLSEAAWDAFFGFYMDTGSRKWGTPYLTRTFFSHASERMADKMLLVMAKRDGRYVAGALNFIGGDCLYGRHWGCVEDHPFLHFELCYYQAIEFAIAHGLARVEAGAQGEHKLARGYEPVTTHSAHHIANAGLRRAVDEYLRSERHHVKMEQEILRDHLPFRQSGDS